MDSTRDPSGKDIWDKISASSGIVAAVLVPIAVAFVGAQYSSALKQQELEVTAKREYVQIGLSILRDPNTSDNIRQWGTNIINHYADVPMSDETKKAFIERGQILPPAPQTTPNAPNNAPVLTATERLGRMDTLQTQGIGALLDRHFDAAAQAYDSAYELWPTFRNVDEIRKLLKSAPPHNDQEWKDLYQKIAKFDLRGVDQKIIDRLREESRER